MEEDRMEEIEDFGEIDAPYGKQLIFKTVSYDNGFNILRLRIKEGKRFTDMDLDVNTVKRWQEKFNEWLENQPDVE